MEWKKYSTLTKISFATPVFITFLGFFLTIQNWGSGYGGILILSGLTLLAIAYCVRFFNKRDRITLDYLKLFFVLSWCAGRIFKLQHWPFSRELGWISNSIFLLGVILCGYDYFFGKNKAETRTKISGLLQIAFSGLILTGVFFKLTRLPLGTPFLIAGVLCLFVWFVFDWIDEEKE